MEEEGIVRKRKIEREIDIKERKKIDIKKERKRRRDREDFEREQKAI